MIYSEYLGGHFIPVAPGWCVSWRDYDDPGAPSTDYYDHVIGWLVSEDDIQPLIYDEGIVRVASLDDKSTTIEYRPAGSRMCVDNWLLIDAPKRAWRSVSNYIRYRIWRRKYRSAS